MRRSPYPVLMKESLEFLHDEYYARCQWDFDQSRARYYRDTGVGTRLWALRVEGYTERVSGSIERPEPRRPIGGGAGIAAVRPLASTLNLVAEGLVGQGIGRYASTTSADVVASPLGRIIPITACHFMGGLEWHPTKE